MSGAGTVLDILVALDCERGGARLYGVCAAPHPSLKVSSRRFFRRFFEDVREKLRRSSYEKIFVHRSSQFIATLDQCKFVAHLSLVVSNLCLCVVF